MNPLYTAHLRKTLGEIEAAGLYKRERIITTPQTAHIGVTGAKNVLNLCANNYLGLADDPRVVAVAETAFILYAWRAGEAAEACDSGAVC